MARWTGTWLEGPGVTLREMRHPDSWLGKDLGLPKEGPTSVASFSSRAFAFIVDVIASGVLGALIVSQLDHPDPWVRQLVGVIVLYVESVILVALTGQTIGMRVADLKVLKLKDVTRVPGFVAALLRTTVLIGTVGVSAFFGKDGRGMHDLLFGYVVVRD